MTTSDDQHSDIPESQGETAGDSTFNNESENEPAGARSAEASDRESHGGESPDQGDSAKQDSNAGKSDENASESSSAADATDSETTTQSGSADGAGSAESESTSGEGDLPEHEPLTPELVEDEAIRGDFMLRWTVILLALLLGVRQIAETQTLVHIRSGEYLTANGILPPANDVFSFSAADKPWVNLNWLFDIAVSAIHGLGGDTALSIFTGLLAAIMFYLLVNISRKDVPTWWNAVCAAVALAVVHQQFTVTPDIITLLGTIWMIRGLSKWSDDGNPKVLWCLVISLCIWSNLDSRAFVGWLIMLAYFIGTFLRPIASDPDKPPLPIRDLAIASVAGFIALAVHPFMWEAWLSPVTRYTVEIPTIQRYLGSAADFGNLSMSGLFSKTSISTHTHQWICALVITGVALLTCVMNFRRLNLGMTLAFLTVLGLGIWHGHEIAVAAVVGCALASLNGQDWYKSNFSLEYTTNLGEVAYGRLGRAVTVLSLAAVAWLAISGRLMGRNGKRVGLGFSPALAATLEGTVEDLKNAHEGNIFTFRLDQGDLLIWAKKKTFIDSRVSVFAKGKDSVADHHIAARGALRPALPISELTVEKQLEFNKVWKQILNDYNVTQAMPRLWGIPADYPTFERLIALPDWVMTSLGATTALFVRLDTDASKEFAQQNQINFVKDVFQSEDESEETTGRADWPRLTTGYQDFLNLKPTPISNDSQKARHELMHAELLMNSPASPLVKHVIGMALATDVIRNANRALYDELNDFAPYQAQSDAYSLLHGLETQLQRLEGYPASGEQRYFQMVHARRQFLMLRPDNFFMLNQLMNNYLQTGRFDLANEMLNRCFEVLDKLPKTEAALQLRRQLGDAKKQIEPRVTAIEEQLDKLFEKNENVDLGALAYELMNQGFPLKALSILDQNKAKLNDMRARLQYALALAECGRLEDAAREFQQFERMGDAPTGATPWRRNAAWVEMARGNYDGAIELCRKRIDDIQQQTIMGLLTTVPLIQPPPNYIKDDTWPVRQTTASFQTLMMGGETAELRYTIATCYLESGRNKLAAKQLSELLETEPDTHLRPIARMYLELITDKPVAPSQSDQIPLLFHGEDFDEDNIDQGEKEIAQGKKEGGDAEGNGGTKKADN